MKKWKKKKQKVALKKMCLLLVLTTVWMSVLSGRTIVVNMTLDDSTCFSLSVA